jgi:hypothetical protein
VAFVFSCIAGILGVLVVAWYGLSGPTGAEAEEEEANAALASGAGVWQEGVAKGEAGAEAGAGGVKKTA